MILLTTSSFVGFYVLEMNPTNSAALQVYIDRYEKHYLCKLLGAELAEAYIADLEEVSQAARFTAIQDEFYLDDADACVDKRIRHSRGLIEVLKAAVFYHFVKDRQVRHTQNGVAGGVNEAQTVVLPKDAYRFAERKWNEMLDTAEAIQWYCETYAPREYADDSDRLYPEYNGEVFTPRYSALM